MHHVLMVMVSSYLWALCDNTIESNNIGMSELCHNGCLLEKLDFCVRLSLVESECFDGYLTGPNAPFQCPLNTDPNWPCPSSVPCLL